MSGVNNYVHTHHCEGDSKKQTSCDSHAEQSGESHGFALPGLTTPQRRLQ